MKLIICEKPSVAKSVSSALGVKSRADGFYEGNGLLVSWCVGHLVSQMCIRDRSLFRLGKALAGSPQVPGYHHIHEGGVF